MVKNDNLPESKNWFAYSLATLLLWGLWAFFSKMAADSLGAMRGLLVEIIGTLLVGLFILFIFLKFKVEFQKLGALFAMLSGMASIGGILLFLYALEMGNVIIIAPLAALYPAVTAVLSKLFLNEDITKRQLFGIFLVIVASILLGL